MTVGELIRQLRAADPDKPCLITVDQWDLDIAAVHHFDPMVTIEADAHLTIAPGFSDDDDGHA